MSFLYFLGVILILKQKNSNKKQQTETNFIFFIIILMLVGIRRSLFSFIYEFNNLYFGTNSADEFSPLDVWWTFE